MYHKLNSILDIINFPKRLSNKYKEKVPLDEVCYSVQISFETNGQIRYLDENQRPRIVEFIGNSWTKSLFQFGTCNTTISVFINNINLKKDQVLTLTKKIKGEVVAQKSFAVLGENTFEGWFKLE
jgi:hypothetical protein